MSQKNKISEPEQNTYRATGSSDRDCCAPVSFVWAVPDGLMRVGVRHTGFLCAGQFYEMAYGKWLRTRMSNGQTKSVNVKPARR